MADFDHVSNSESSEGEEFHAPEKGRTTREPSQPHSALSHRFLESPQKSLNDRPRKDSSEDAIAVMVPAPARPWEYQPWRGDVTVETVLDELVVDGEQGYKIEFEDGRKEDVTFDKLITLRNGRNALDLYNNGDPEANFSVSMESQDDSQESTGRGKRVRKSTHRANGYVDISKEALSSGEDELFADQVATKKRRLGNGRASMLTNKGTRQSSRIISNGSSRPPSRVIQEESSDSDMESSTEPGGRTSTRASGRTARSTNAKSKSASKWDGEKDDEDELAESENSDIQYVQSGSKKSGKNRRNRSQSQEKGKPGRGRPRIVRESSSSSDIEQPTRRSGRDRVVKSMREQDMDEEIYADEVAKTNTPKVISIREIYRPIPKQSPFRSFHNSSCDVCKGIGNSSNKGTSPLIYCQGCSTSIHKVCLGYRSAREHMVTKIGHENFVLQCRRCIGVAGKKDPLAPPLDICQGCSKPGPSCKPFSAKKTAKQEEKMREENDGDDPITEVSEELVNNPNNVLFRCIRCYRASHFDHLPRRNKFSKTPESAEELRILRLKEYTPKWHCKDCCDTPEKPQGLVAWRPADPETYDPEDTVDTLREDKKEYLIKWEDKSYFECNWMPGSWVWGITAKTMRNAFARRDEGANEKPKWTTEEAIPEEYLTMEIIFDVEYADEFEPQSEKFDKTQISMIDQVFVKFEGLTYDDVVWQAPPKPEETKRWSAFVAAYNEYLVGKYFEQPSALVLKQRADEFRSLNYQKKVGLQIKQPSELTFPMYKYQVEGFNWLLKNFHAKKNVVLADEMGLGKTVQIISLIAYLVKNRPKCWPFLVVTPNSTCPNWRREFKKWAPGLRVVAYYGGKTARDMAYQYELYPEKSSDMKAHVVITSYEGPVDDQSRTFFKKIKWAGLIVDEGQRLKNDENLLYKALTALKAPFQVLLTGTPLQNNKRELFNLLQFLDVSVKASELDIEYEELTKQNIPQLQEFIKPFFLRRTKLQVLKHLPSLTQVILPVTMSVVQKKLYKSILAKNPQLIKSIFGQSTAVLRPTERGNLNNILMQLRKCLCHPFLYSSAIEERSVGEEAMLRNLIDASAKFQLLEIMLPKLRDRGHRVLMFSQFLNQLDMIEDFLKGLDLPFRRIDGTVSAQEKQKRIDEFNAPGSPIFACLLSTRAGGVGINLASADTVIIMDPDFNPQQDIQAISRAHRIGQLKKVLVFQLMTKDTAEEKIIQIGRKKLALGALIETIGTEDDSGVDMESILKHGTEALFNDDDRNDIHYDSASVDKLLDRTHIENANMDDDKNTESQFTLARVWAYDKGTLADDVGDPDVEQAAPDISVWEQILKQREADAAAEAKRNMHEFGRGKRARQNVVYEKTNMDVDDDGNTPVKSKKPPRPNESASDQDFSEAGDTEGDEESEQNGAIDPRELETGRARSQDYEDGSSTYHENSHGHPNPPRRKKPPQPHPQPHSGDRVSGQGTFYPNESARPKPSNGNPNGNSFPSGEPYQSRYPNQGPVIPTPLGGQIPGPNFGFGHAHQPERPASSYQGQFGNGGHTSRPNFPAEGPQSNHFPGQPIDRNGNPNQEVGRFTTNQETQNYRGPAPLIHPGPGAGRNASMYHPTFHQHPQPHFQPPIPANPIDGTDCDLCGMAHIGIIANCPQITTETEIRVLLDGLKDLANTDQAEKVEIAKRFLRGELAKLTQKKKARKLAKQANSSHVV